MKKQLMILFAVMMIVSAGCADGNATSPVTPVPTITKPPTTALPLQTSSLSATLSPSPSLTLTPIPTLSSEDAYQRLVELLQNNAGCSLPCLWGITPGISTISEVRNMLLPFTGIADLSDLPVNGIGGISLRYPLKKSFLDLYLVYFPVSGSQTLNALYFETRAFHNDVDPAQDPSFYGSDLYSEMLNRYTLHSILSTYGIPSEVLVFPEPIDPPYFNLRVLYPEKGIYLSYGTFATEQGANYAGCPSKMFISLYLLSAESNRNYQAILPTVGPDWGNVFPISEGNFNSLEEATHMSLDEFYQSFKDPSDRCLETPKAIWMP